MFNRFENVPADKQGHDALGGRSIACLARQTAASIPRYVYVFHLARKPTNTTYPLERV